MKLIIVRKILNMHKNVKFIYIKFIISKLVALICKLDAIQKYNW
jgi:hypothetical protein